MGDVPRGSSTTSTTAWKDFGFDLDGKISDAKSRDVCVRAAGAPSSVQVDGSLGRDNSFGANIVPIIQSGGNVPNLSSFFTDALRSGLFTLQLRVTGLDPTAVDQTNIALVTESFGSHLFDPDGGARPKFAPTEDWPVRSDLLVDPKSLDKGSKEMLGFSYVVHGTLVAFGPQLTLGLVGALQPFDLPLQQAVIVMTVHGDRVEDGTIAGVMNTEKLIVAGEPFGVALSKSLCGSAWDGIAQQLRQTSDILDDGTNDPGKACNAISIGIGFTAHRIANPMRIESPTPQFDPCVLPKDASAD